MEPIKRLLSFQGRASRVEFWRLYLLESVLTAACWAASIFVALSELPGSKILAAALLALIALLLLPWAAVVLRRLHDRNKGWPWLLLFAVLPYALGALTVTWRTPEGMAAVSVIAALAAIVLVCWSWIELGFLRGTRGPNRFGPEPSRR